MKITVIVCTYNRSQSLRAALDSIGAQDIPESVEWDVVVVDNNSTDQTCQTVHRFCEKNAARFSYVFEPEQGLSHARNTGIRNACGDILVFTDDDVLVERDWLWNLTSSLSSEGWMGAGGPIIPIWAGTLPVWLSPAEMDTIGPFAGFYEGTAAGDLTRPPYGANMAFRREAFQRYGCFRVDLGRSSDNLLGREEVEFANRLLAAGERLRYEPAAIVRHSIAEHRMKKSYILLWCYWDGRSEVADSGAFESEWSVAGVPLYLFRRLARWSLQSIASPTEEKRFFCQRNVWKLAGHIHGCFRESRHRRNRSSESERVSADWF